MDNDFADQLRDWNERKKNGEATLELRDIPEHFWLALVEEELKGLPEDDDSESESEDA